MFIRRQDIIDRFDSNFRLTEDGQVLFQPGKSEIGLPITSQEYDAATSTFGKIQMINMAMSWLATLGAGAIGIYDVIAKDNYLTFFIALGVATLFSFAISLRGQLGILLPFIRRRDDLLKAMKNEEVAIVQSDVAPG